MEAGFIPVGGAAGGVAPAPQAVTMNPGNVIRAPGLKRGKVEEAISDRIKLETVLGLTVGSNAALDCDPNTEVVAYPAGCTVVLYNVRKNRQSHLLNSSRKSVTCVAFSPDGRYLATGECGHAPAVRVWDLQDPSASGAVQIAEFPGHTHGVSCVAFSTSSKYLVSVGSQHDMIVNVWDWRSNLKLASNKVSSRVKAVSFSENGNYFVTVGFRHVKFWYLEYSRNNKIKEPVPLMGRSAILGEQKDNEFCDVSCGRGACADSTYAITRGGLLCEFNSRRLLDKWVELRTQSANCMSLGSEYIFVGCAEGLVRCFSPQSLRYVTTLPRAHYLGVDVAQGTDISHMYRVPSGARWADALALAYDETHHKLTAVYNDHSLYVWDLRDIKRVGKSHSALYHSACIWGVDMLTSGDTSLLLTCSSDDTVRMWGWQRQGPLNVYSNELAKVLYIDPELKFLKDQDLTASSDKDKSKSYDDKIGVRCVRVSPNGNHIASGDRSGNVLIHSSAGSLLHTLEAHDAEVLCVEYSPGVPALLASASRDRLIHVFDVEQGYQILQTLDDHSSSITAVRFLQHSGTLQMVSCGADKTILFRTLVNSGGVYQFSRASHASGRATLYDMEVDAGGRHVLTACQDRNVRVYSAATGRHTKTFRGTTAEDGTLIKVALDSSGIYLATSSTDKVLSVYDYYSGECMATMYGHSEIVTGLRFTPDCSHLISAGGDGCIFIWRVPHDMCVTMRARLAQQAIRTGKKVPSNGLMSAESEVESALGSPPRELQRVPTDYTLRIGRLPSWAAKSLGDETSVPAPTPPVAPPPPARGKWAKRINTCDKRIDSDGSKDSSIDSGTDTRYFEKRRDQTAVKQRPKSLVLCQRARVESLFQELDSHVAAARNVLALSPRSKEVTLVVKSRLPDGRTRHHTDDSSLGSLKYEDQESTEHDGDIEDISDGERTSSSESRNRPTYYPGNTSDAAGDFTVNAMDVEELRASQRRSKRWRPEARLELSAATSVNTSPQHSDEDDVSTPSGDNEPQRNPLGGSCESIDVAARREKYMKSAFDSLSGAETEAKGVTGGSTSLSSQHLSPRAPPSGEAARRRQELNRRILDTRRQLESLGYRSNLKSSQSTTDLSYIPEKEQNSRRNRPVSTASPNSGRGFASSRSHLSPYDREGEESGGMRRAISLSDLAVTPTPAPRSNTGNTAKQAPPSPSQPNKSPAVFARPAPRYNKGNITRSSSVGVLNQSDSESDGQPSRPRAAAGVLRPTISSMNKAAAPARRRPLNNAYSTVNLSTTATRDDSSSEAEERPGGRARAVSVDHTAQRRIGRSGSERELSARAREVTNRLAGVRPRTDAKSEPAEAQLSSRQLCSALTEQLTRTANKVVHLYRTLHDPGQDGGSGDNHVLISGLEAAMLETQKVLRGAVERQLSPSAGTDSRTDRTDGRTDRTDAALSTADTTRLKLEELVSKESTSGNPAMSLIEQYSDILLNMMQNKIVSQLQSPQSLPPDGGGS